LPSAADFSSAFQDGERQPHLAQTDRHAQTRETSADNKNIHLSLRHQHVSVAAQSCLAAPSLKKIDISYTATGGTVITNAVFCHPRVFDADHGLG
jgi:hypothetical protein